MKGNTGGETILSPSPQMRTQLNSVEIHVYSWWLHRQPTMTMARVQKLPKKARISLDG